MGRKAIAMGVLRWPQKRRDLVRTPDVLPGLWLPARTRCLQVGNNTCHATENSRIGLLAEFTYRLSKPAHAPNSLRQKPLKRSASSLARRRTYTATSGALGPPGPLRWPGGARTLRRQGLLEPGVSCESGNRTDTQELGPSKASAFIATATRKPKQTNKKKTKTIARVLRWRTLR